MFNHQTITALTAHKQVTPMRVINGEKYYDSYECAAILGVSRFTIYSLRKKRRLPATHLGARDYTREADLAKYLHAPDPVRPRKRDRDSATARTIKTVLTIDPTAERASIKTLQEAEERKRAAAAARGKRRSPRKSNDTSQE